MRIHKYLCVFLAGLCLFAYISDAEAADLVSVVVADTFDEDIGDSTEADFKNIRYRMEEVAHYTGLQLREIAIKGEKTSAKYVLNKLKDLKVNGDNVVIFYFSGHGYRSGSKESPWPNLWFSQEDVGLEFDLVMEILEEKQPRLFIAIADVCNNKVPDEYLPPMISRFAPIFSKEKIKENYKKLFLDTNGVILITSSEAGQYSWGSSSGGLYTTAFLKSLKEETLKSNSVNWGVILESASQSVIEEKTETDQTPFYLINVQ